MEEQKMLIKRDNTHEEFEREKSSRINRIIKDAHRNSLLSMDIAKEEEMDEVMTFVLDWLDRNHQETYNQILEEKSKWRNL
jgi:uncharacterized protein YcbK (DUF882 family)